jgi:hypothetical protein
VPITTEFWATTAQVIPALLLAFVLTQRPAERREDREKVPLKPARLSYSTVVLVTIAVGVSAEFLALDGLLGGGGRGTARVVVIAIGVLAFWAVLAVALWSGLKFFPEQDADMDRMSLRLGAVLVGHLLFALVVATLPLAVSIWLAIKM